MLKDEYLEISKELSSLKEERNELEKKLNLPHSKEFIIECKFDIIKIDEKIPVLEDKLRILNIQIEEEKRKQLEEERRRKQEELDYKKIYITLTEYMSLFIRVFNITDLSNKSVEYLLNNYTKQELFRIIDLSNFLESSVFHNFIKDIHTNNASLNTLLDKYEDEYMSLFIRVFNITDLSNKSVEYLLNNYTKQELFRIIDLSNFLESSVFHNFIKDIHTNNASLNTLLDKYEDKCNFIENLKLPIKNKIKKVEDKCDLKFNGVIRRYYFCVEFVKDFSQEIDFESFILNNFEDYVYGEVESYVYDRDAWANQRIVEDYWEDMSEYQKLKMVSKENFCVLYGEQLYDKLTKVIGDDFDFDVYVKAPKNTTPILMQTQEYKYKKDKVYEKNVQKYEDLIAKKRYEKKDKSHSFDCIKNLNEDSSIGDIANCYCKYEGFNNWEHDKKNKKIIFKLLRADGKNYSKMRKLEVKELEGWPKTVKK